MVRRARRKKLKPPTRPPTPEQLYFGQMVRLCRTRLGWSQRQMATYLRYADKGMISMIEHGRREPTLWRAALLTQLCGMSLAVLYGLEPPPEPCGYG